MTASDVVDNQLFLVHARRKGPQVAGALLMMLDLYEALLTTVRAGFVHRDGKLDNVLPLPRPAVHGGAAAQPFRAALADFGIAVEVRGDAVELVPLAHRKTVRALRGTTGGTPLYDAPENGSEFNTQFVELSAIQQLCKMYAEILNQVSMYTDRMAKTNDGACGPVALEPGCTACCCN